MTDDYCIIVCLSINCSLGPDLGESIFADGFPSQGNGSFRLESLLGYRNIRWTNPMVDMMRLSIETSHEEVALKYGHFIVQTKSKK